MEEFTDLHDDIEFSKRLLDEELVFVLPGTMKLLLMLCRENLQIGELYATCDLSSYGQTS